MAQSNQDRVRTQRAKLAAVQVLREMGEVLSGAESIKTLQVVCDRHGLAGRRVGEASWEHFERIVRLAPAPKPKHQGEVVEPYIVNLMRRPEWKPEPHLRAAEIDALPVPVNMGTTAVDYGWDR